MNCKESNHNRRTGFPYGGIRPEAISENIEARSSSSAEDGRWNSCDQKVYLCCGVGKRPTTSAERG